MYCNGFIVMYLLEGIYYKLFIKRKISYIYNYLVYYIYLVKRKS